MADEVDLYRTHILKTYLTLHCDSNDNLTDRLKESKKVVDELYRQTRDGPPGFEDEDLSAQMRRIQERTRKKPEVV